MGLPGSSRVASDCDVAPGVMIVCGATTAGAKKILTMDREVAVIVLIRDLRFIDLYPFSR